MPSCACFIQETKEFANLEEAISYMNLQSIYQKAINFAAEKHQDQKVPGTNSSYLIHPAMVAMEIIFAAQSESDFDLELAVQVALLHDVLEDTRCSFKEIKEQFGVQVADGVLALTKNELLPIEKQIPDSLDRIRHQPKEIWAVKLADRISNMQKPPQHWDIRKRKNYQLMAQTILEALQGSCEYLEDRLKHEIEEYNHFIMM